MSKKKLLAAWLAFVSLSPCQARESLSLSTDKGAYALGDTLRYELRLTSDEAVRSKVAYVELLAPEGGVVKRIVRKMEGDRCSGTIVMEAANYSGLYELRAYTRYMLSQDKDGYSSKVLPVYEWKDGKKRVKRRVNRWEKGKEWNLYQPQFHPRFPVTPEQGITVRGMLYDAAGKWESKAIPVTMTANDFSMTARTDERGCFEFDLGDKDGDFEASFVYPKEGEGAPVIVLDAVFSPEPRKYTKAERRLLDDYVPISHDHYYNELNPGRLLCAKQLMSDLFDATGASVFSFNKTSLTWEALFYAMASEWTLSTEPSRYVRARKPWGQLDMLADTMEVFDEGGKMDLGDFEYLYLCTDSAVCARFNYRDYSPRSMPLNRTQLGGGMRMLFLGNGANSTGEPSAVIFFIPYPKGTPLAERWKNTQPNVRHAVLHGYSE